MIRRSFVLLLTVSLGCSLAALGQTPGTSSARAHSPGEKTPFEFDKSMLVLLVRPANAPDFPKDQLERMQGGHMSNMRTLAAEGKLLKAGPIEDLSGRDVRGIFILTTESETEAREWVSGDPLIKAGRLAPEFMKWFVEKGSLK